MAMTTTVPRRPRSRADRHQPMFWASATHLPCHPQPWANTASNRLAQPFRALLSAPIFQVRDLEQAAGAFSRPDHQTDGDNGGGGSGVGEYVHSQGALSCWRAPCPTGLASHFIDSGRAVPLVAAEESRRPRLQQQQQQQQHAAAFFSPPGFLPRTRPAWPSCETDGDGDTVSFQAALGQGRTA